MSEVISEQISENCWWVWADILHLTYVGRTKNEALSKLYKVVEAIVTDELVTSEEYKQNAFLVYSELNE